MLPLAVSYADPRILQQWNEFQRSGRQAGAPSDPQLLNRYTYARNNPLAYRDDTGHWIWLVVGGVGGAIVGLGAYALTHQDNFDWKQAALWVGGGALIGATLGGATELVVGAIGAQAAATTVGAAATTAGAVAGSPTGRRTILWLENQLPRVQHIMAQKHAWDRLVNLSGNLQQDYQAVQPYIQKAIDSGIMRTIGVNDKGQQVVSFLATINGQKILVQAIQIAEAVFQIGDAWVVTK